jgi:uncharacterized paraquat-inducible protein A
MPLVPALNLALLFLWPVAWTAPLVRTSLLPFLGSDAVSVLSGVSALWESDPILSALVALFGVALPYAKTLGLAALHAGRLPARHLPVFEHLARLSMADVFLVAVTIVAVKGVGLGSVETAWGLHFFAACVLASLLASILTRRAPA